MIFAFDPKTLVLNEAIVISTFVYSKAAFSSVYSQFIHIVFLDHFYILHHFWQIEFNFEMSVCSEIKNKSVESKFVTQRERIKI